MRIGCIFNFMQFSEKNAKFPEFPLGLEKWEGIFQLGNFEQTGKSGKITQNTREVKEF